MDKRIVVTGCSRGIGLEVVKKLASLGCQVLAISRNCRHLEELSEELHGLIPVEAEITEASGLEKIVSAVEERWGGIDGLVHNAGALLNKPFEKTSMEDFQKIYRVNVFAVAELTRVLLPFLKPGSHVVAISSMGGIQGSMKFSGLSSYSSSKAAVITLMELLAEEYKEKGVSFNALAIGAVQTEMLEEAFPGYQAPTSAPEMGTYVADFVLHGNKMYNGKVLQVSKSTP
jgi:NAD(P)-dependent dehydrogenase (short-subunit alcohol dehydrogenase family)